MNVALGRYEKILAEQARRAGTTKTNLARILLVSGLEKLAAGKARITGPALAPLP